MCTEKINIVYFKILAADKFKSKDGINDDKNNKVKILNTKFTLNFDFLMTTIFSTFE